VESIEAWSGEADPARALTTFCELASESQTTDHFDARFAPDGNAGRPVRAVKEDVAALLDEINGSPCTTPQLRRFLAHFVLIEFDFLHEGATHPPAAITRIRDCLGPSDATKAPLIWTRLVQLARGSAGKSGVFDRTRLVRLTSHVAAIG
jgi:hypothetical protein